MVSSGVSLDPNDGNAQLSHSWHWCEEIAKLKIPTPLLVWILIYASKSVFISRILKANWNIPQWKQMLACIRPLKKRCWCSLLFIFKAQYRCNKHINYCDGEGSRLMESVLLFTKEKRKKHPSQIYKLLERKKNKTIAICKPLILRCFDRWEISKRVIVLLYVNGNGPTK